jgi:hypothetical protein
VTFDAARVACYILCGRRGNPKPSSLAADYKEIKDRLERIKSGREALWDTPPRRARMPVISNMFVKLAPNPHPRVHLSTSTTTGGNPTAYPRIIDLSQWTDTWLHWPMS